MENGAEISTENPSQSLVDNNSEEPHYARTRRRFGSLLACAYTLIAVTVALGIEVSVTQRSKDVFMSQAEAFYVYLYGGSILFFLYYHGILSLNKIPNMITSLVPKKRSYDVKQHVIVSYSSPSAANMYLRLGAIVFGTTVIISNTIRVIIHADVTAPCFDVLTLLHEVFSVVFTFMQMHFIFQNAKMSIHKLRAFSRFGMMHIMATNLCVWIRAMVVEEKFIMHELKEVREHEKEGHHHHGDLVSSLGSVSNETMKFDKLVDLARAQECHNTSSHLFSILTTLAPVTATCLVEYSIICSAVMFVLWGHIDRRKADATEVKRRKRSIRIDCGSTGSGLFCGLICVLCIIITLVLAGVYKDEFINTWVYIASDCVIYLIATCVSILALQRISLLSQVNRSTLLDDILLWIGLSGQAVFCIFAMVAIIRGGGHAAPGIGRIRIFILVLACLRMLQAVVQTVLISLAMSMHAADERLQRQKPGRNLITFLLMTNLALFAVNTMESQRIATNPLVRSLYTDGPMVVFMHGSIPLVTFFRFHSSVCLVEIWKNAYKT